MIKKISVLLGIIMSIGVISGAVHSYFAKDKDLKLVEYRLNTKILQDKIDYLQIRIWKLEDRYGSLDKMPSDIKSQYRQLQKDLKRLEIQFQVLIKKGGIK